MSAEAPTAPSGNSELTDESIVERVRQGDVALFEVIMRRYNQRLYRVARAIVGDDSEAEDVMQDAYVRAYAHLGQFAGKARFVTWLTKIAAHEALARVRRRSRFVDMEDYMAVIEAPGRGPEQAAADSELRALLEKAISALPQPFRATFVLREVEELSTAETAACLDIPEETVKTRLHRARAALRQQLYARVDDARKAVFPFGYERCDRVVATVLARIRTARHLDA
jgi:RNA polymerase sigma-70 factor (ECF subfamily)